MTDSLTTETRQVTGLEEKALAGGNNLTKQTQIQKDKYTLNVNTSKIHVLSALLTFDST